MPHDHSNHTQVVQDPSTMDSIPSKVKNFGHFHKTPILANNETRTRWVVWLTLVTMFVELGFGWWTNSMALTADGWHMASHAGALALTLFGYAFAKKYDSDPRFSFGTGKVFALTGFASAIALFVAGVMVALESIHHLMNPEDVDFSSAMWVAIIGLVVNLISACLLSEDEASQGQHHQHHHHHDHHNHHGEDHNLKSAYLHVLADALTSVLAIMALGVGYIFNWWIFDPLIGVLGGLIIVRWAVQLIKDTSWVLLDARPDMKLEHQLRHHFDHQDGVWITDLHIWDLGLGRYACILTLIAEKPKPTSHYKSEISSLEEFVHCSIEVYSTKESSPTIEGTGNIE